MVDVNKDFIQEAKNYLGEENVERIEKFYISGLETFIPEEKKYDCIWVQWVLGYLRDDDLVRLFRRCKKALKPNGICVMKDNVAQSKVEFDELDNCYTRTRQDFLDIIHRAKMRVISDDKQLNFPPELYEIRIIAFK